jgi:hypothetical protein
MDLKAYYQKTRAIEESLREEHVVVISKETPDGGKAGVKTEVPKKIAARMVTNGWAELASAEVAREFRELQAEAKEAADALVEASRLQLSVVPTRELQQLRKTKSEKN